MSEPVKPYYEFDSFRLDPAERLLRRDGVPVQLTPKMFDILLFLVERNGRLAPKDELMRAVWPDTFVEDANLTVNISSLRKALGESGNGHQYIETVQRRGYRFGAEVKECGGAEAKISENASCNFVDRSLLNDICEGCARRDSNNAKIHRQIEITVKQAFPSALALLFKIAAPKLRIGSGELIDNYIY